MAKSSKPTGRPRDVVALLHDEASRKNIPTAEMESVAHRLEEDHPVAPVRYPRQRPLAAGATRERDGDLDPQIVWKGARITLTQAQRVQLQETGEVEIGDAQLVWRGKDQQDWSDLVVQAPQLFVQEKVHPKAIIDDLKRRSGASNVKGWEDAPDLFADFNGLDPEARTEFYQHEGHWTNRMILGDSLQVMASLAEREALRGKVQCIYFDPPYGIKFNSNWQVSTQSRDVKDGKQTDISREPEQVKAFRDTWKDGIHSYLTYLRDRLTVARELLTESGSIFVQIGDENVHRVRALMDEVFGDNNFCCLITFRKTTGKASGLLDNSVDFLLWYAKRKQTTNYRQLFEGRSYLGDQNLKFYPWLGACFTIVLGGWLSDRILSRTGNLRFARSYMSAASLLVVATALALVPFVHSLALALALISLANAANSLPNSVYYNIVTESSPEAMIGTFSGITLMIASASSIVAPTITGLIVNRFSYDDMFLSASLVALAGMGCMLMVRLKPRAGEAPNSPAPV